MRRSDNTRHTDHTQLGTTRRAPLRTRLAAIALAIAASAASIANAGVRFEVVIPDDLPSYTGRVYVAVAQAPRPNAGSSRGGSPSPRQRMHSWFHPPPVFAVDVVDARPGQVITIEAGCLAHPHGPDELPAGRWLAEAVLRLNPDSAKAGYGAGDRHSLPRPFSVPDAKDAAHDAKGARESGDEASGDVVVRLTPDQVVPTSTFEATERVALVEIRSALLSEFHGRDVLVRAGVVLPEGFDPDGHERAPVLIDVPGFGGNHRGALQRAGMLSRLGLDGVIYVVPDPECYRGHSVFADSATNGPWGAMLVRELVPEIERRYRGAGAEHRYVTGVSSGGWSSLWLQIQYPDAFAGCWSFVPDPVDFRDFQMIDLYAPGANMYVDERGEPRPLARDGGRVTLLYRDFVAREQVLGPGGQIHSFEAVFSPRGSDGAPVPMFDPRTGGVDPRVVRAWKAYDIRLILQERWALLAPELAGKIRVYAGSADNFYLEGAVALLGEWARSAGADMHVEVVEGLRHAPASHGMRHMAETIRQRWDDRQER